jgi:integrase/recombinase XerD
MVAIKDDKQLLEDYLKDLVLQGSVIKTIENYRSATKVYMIWLHEKKLTYLSVQDQNNKDIIEEFLHYLREERTNGKGEKLSFARIKVIFSALNSFYEFLEYKGYVKKNTILVVRKRYLKQFKKGYVPAQRKIIDVETMAAFLNSITSLQSKVICLILVKTGIRRNELINIDIDDIDLNDGKITLKQRMFKKRTNTTVYIDDETIRLLNQWIKRRETLTSKDNKPLFVGERGRLNRHGVETAVMKWTVKFGLHNPASKNLEDHFTCHTMRHCNTTYLRRNGMPREFIKELRGDKRRETIDIYDHIDPQELKRAYLACIPKFGIY